MRKLLFSAVVALSGCVAADVVADPRGAVQPGQRLIVIVQQSPGPWIVADPDSKAETALKLMPLGNFLQGMQEERINELSKEIQPYLPRPRYGEAIERALIAALKSSHDGPVQTSAEAGIDARQRRDWNAASDQLDWRRKYFAPPYGSAPRDYSKNLSLDDAVIVDVNVSFGLEPDEEDRTLPALAAATRLYRADTSRLLASREDLLTDKTSSTTLSEFRVTPGELTDRLYAMATPLGTQIAGNLVRTLGLQPPAAPISAPPPATAPAPEATFFNGQPASGPPETPPLAPPADSTPPATAMPPAEAAAPAAPPETSTPTTPSPAVSPGPSQ